MSKVPPINAEILRVQASSGGESFDGPAAPGAEKWAGTAPAFVTDRTLSEVQAGGGGADVTVETRLVMPDNLAPVAVGDTLTYRKGAVDASRKVRAIEERSDYGFIRIYFEDQ